MTTIVLGARSKGVLLTERIRQTTITSIRKGWKMILIEERKRRRRKGRNPISNDMVVDEEKIYAL